MPDASTPREAALGDVKEVQAEQALSHIRQALSGLRFGEVSVIVQDGVIVQVERTERKRLRKGDR